MAIIRLNQAVAVSYAQSAADGLAILEQVASQLDRYSHFHAAKADLLLRDGQMAAARDCFQIAINLTQNAVDKVFLQEKLGRLTLH